MMKALCGSSSALAMRLRIAIDPLVGMRIDDVDAIESVTSTDNAAGAGARVSSCLDTGAIADPATTDAANESVTSQPDEGVGASELSIHQDKWPSADVAATDAAVASQPEERVGSAEVGFF